LGVTTADIEAGAELLERASAEVVKHEASVGEISAKLATEKASLDALEKEIQAQIAIVSDYDQGLRASESQLEVHRSRVANAEADLTRQTSLLEQAKNRVELANQELLALDSSSLAAPDLVGEATEKALHEAEEVLAEAEARQSETRNLLHQQEREREALAAKVSALELALRSEEGEPGLASEPGVTGLVSDSLTVTPGYETAIARALGSLADALLLATKDDALGLVYKRTGTDQARVDLVIASGRATRSPAHAGLEHASECVSGPEGVVALLASTYIASDATAAAKIWKAGSLPEGATIVTLAGDVFSAHVVQTGSGQAPSRIELAALRDTAKQDLSALSITLERTKFAAEEAVTAKERAAEGVKRALAELREADAKRAEFGEQMSRSRAARDAADAEVQRLQAGIDEAELARDAANQALEEATRVHQETVAAERPVVDDSAKVLLLATLDEISGQEVDARIALEAARERARGAQDSLAILRQRLADHEAALKREEARHQERIERQRRAVAVLQVLPGLLLAANTCVDEATQALGSEEARRDSHHTELLALREAEGALRDRLGAITDSVHSLEMQIYEKKLQRTTVLERANDELGLDEKTLMAEYSPDMLVPPDSSEGDQEPRAFDRREQEARLASAQRKLDQLGRVNPLALEEFQALEQRHVFLKAQLEDLHKTRSDLEAIMADLDTTMHTIFFEAFQDTQKAFDEVFPILFPGGAGSLSLTDPESLLTTGIEVSVRPAGKKIERLSLL
jgi:chromosome segregation protein